MTSKQKKSQMTALGYCDLKWVKVERGINRVDA